MEKYNKYGESLYFDCNCKDNCSCGSSFVVLYDPNA